MIMRGHSREGEGENSDVSVRQECMQELKTGVSCLVTVFVRIKRTAFGIRRISIAK